MKKYFFTMLLAASSICMMGQTKTVKGHVIDENGNFVPDAEVKVTGGPQKTSTDANGAFTLEVGQFTKSLTAKCPYATKKVKITSENTNDMIFRMKRQRQKQWFLNAEAGYIGGEGDYPCFGVMGGYLAKWGFYAKGLVSYAFDGGMGAVGVTKRVFPWMHVSLGAGISSAHEYYTTTLPMLEFGWIFRISSHLSANLHYGLGIGEDDMLHNPSVGFGYAF